MVLVCLYCHTIYIICMYFNSLLNCYISRLDATGHSDFYKCVCPVTRASS